MKMTLEMAPVNECGARDCVYNVKESCCAHAITIGDGAHPGCDTFLTGSPHSRMHALPAGVGACKVSGCAYNDDYECAADGIQVARENGGVRCMTFTVR